MNSGAKTPTMALETLRKAVLNAGQSGKNLMIDLGETNPDFWTTYTDEYVMPTNLVFNRAAWLEKSTRELIRREEDSIVDFALSNDFQLLIRSCAVNEEQIKRIIPNIPCFD